MELWFFLNWIHTFQDVIHMAKKIICYIIMFRGKIIWDVKFIELEFRIITCFFCIHVIYVSSTIFFNIEIFHHRFSFVLHIYICYWNRFQRNGNIISNYEFGSIIKYMSYFFTCDTKAKYLHLESSVSS